MSQSLVFRIDKPGVDRWFERARLLTQDASELMAGVAGVLADETEQAFETESDPTTGVPWAKLAASTIESRRKEGHWPGKIMQRSGQLAVSYVTDSGPDFARIGSNKVQAAIQNQGGTTRPHTIKPRNKKALAFGGGIYGAVQHPGSTLPARPQMGLSDRGREEIGDLLDSYLSD
ncbi:phage virion morphogenesis protein [Solimonas sp. SE-A11]|uniref:phage virion morphogenesis protein n=1 Tax=Solimonas sp. SE-A11 TaxID=3054954 RepID=UPI00259CA9C9|nr:phage virion morphogenesis protein [Solimonas sp. SE-A11]MDM4768625.1 phage virion morphogenesis protein [Solimonas sp. SE-A11]